MRKIKTKFIVALIILIILAIPSAIYGYSYYTYNTDLSYGENLLNEEKYDDSIEVFQKLKSNKFFNNSSDFINSKITLASELKESKETFETANNLLNEKKFLEAIDEYSKIESLDEKRYAESQEKIKEAKNLYITENISKAKENANNKEYDNAISVLETLLKFDTDNEEVINLKNEYTLEIEKIKYEEEQKLAQQKLEEENTYNSNDTNSNSLIPSNNDSSDIAFNPQNTQDESGYTVKFNGEGFFKVNYNSGPPTPEGFGLRSAIFSIQPPGIYYTIIGNISSYEITFHLPTGSVTQSGTSSGDYLLSADVPKGQSINIDISAVYKGKTYTGSFSKVINDRY